MRQQNFVLHKDLYNCDQSKIGDELNVHKYLFQTFNKVYIIPLIDNIFHLHKRHKRHKRHNSAALF